LKKVYIQLEKFLRIFHLFAEKPPCADLHEILLEGSTSRHNQLYQILSRSDQGFWFCGGSNFWSFHRKEKSPLTHGLNYRSACDVSTNSQNCFCNNFVKFDNFVNFDFFGTTMAKTIELCKMHSFST